MCLHIIHVLLLLNEKNTVHLVYALEHYYDYNYIISLSR
jgi:hypothetical protein